MSAPSTSGLSVELLLRVIDAKYGCFTLLYHSAHHVTPHVMHLTSLRLISQDKYGIIAQQARTNAAAS